MPNRMDSTMAKGAGAAKAVKARAEGLVGVFQTLAKQHGEAGALVKRLKADPTKHAELWPKIRAELTSHEQAEMREVYPVLREYEATRTIADHHDAEAGQLSALITRLNAMDPTSSTWAPTYEQLAQMVDHHVDEEENEIFPTAQETVGADRARAMDAPFVATKKQIMEAV